MVFDVRCGAITILGSSVIAIVVSFFVLCAQLEIELPPCTRFCTYLECDKSVLISGAAILCNLSISVLYPIIHRVCFQMQSTLFEFVQ